MTSFTKPEVRNVSLITVDRGGPSHVQSMCNISRNFGHVILIHVSEQTDRQTDRHADRYNSLYMIQWHTRLWHNRVYV